MEPIISKNSSGSSNSGILNSLADSQKNVKNQLGNGDESSLFDINDENGCSCADDDSVGLKNRKNTFFEDKVTKPIGK